MDVVREEKKMLIAQARKLNNELRASLRRREVVSAQQGELNETINELELECRAAESDVRHVAFVEAVACFLSTLLAIQSICSLNGEWLTSRTVFPAEGVARRCWSRRKESVLPSSIRTDRAEPH